MRFVSNLVFVVLLALVLSTGWAFWTHRESRQEEREEAARNVQALQRAINVRAVRELGPLNEFGFPPTIDPKWFGAGLPSNTLLDHDRPWIEIAAGQELYALNPKDPVAVDRSKAEFWYNPRRGIVRARVPQMASDRLTLETYNDVNGTQMDRLFPTAPRPSDIEFMAGDHNGNPIMTTAIMEDDSSR